MSTLAERPSKLRRAVTPIVAALAALGSILAGFDDVPTILQMIATVATVALVAAASLGSPATILKKLAFYKCMVQLHPALL